MECYICSDRGKYLTTCYSLKAALEARAEHFQGCHPNINPAQHDNDVQKRYKLRSDASALAILALQEAGYSSADESLEQFCVSRLDFDVLANKAEVEEKLNKTHWRDGKLRRGLYVSTGGLTKAALMKWNGGAGKYEVIKVYPSNGLWCEKFLPIFENDNLMLKQLANAAAAKAPDGFRGREHMGSAVKNSGE